MFETLEVNDLLDVHNSAHLWLLHHLFLSLINADIEIWAGGWNSHKMRVPLQSRQSPEEMYGFGMLTQGLRGEQLQLDGLPNVPDADDIANWVNGNLHHIPAHEDEAQFEDLEIEPPRGLAVFIDALDAFVQEQTPAGDDAASLVARWIHAVAFCKANGVEGF